MNNEQEFNVCLFLFWKVPGSYPVEFQHEVISSLSIDKETSQNIKMIQISLNYNHK